MVVLILAHSAATLYMTGVIWFVQLVHYPLFNRVTENFPRFAISHASRTGWVVMAPMVIELVSAVGLFWNWPAQIPKLFWGINLIGVLAIWASTFLVQVPCHERLQKGFDQATYERLVQTNWLRTGIWSLRCLLWFWILATLMHANLN